MKEHWLWKSRGGAGAHGFQARAFAQKQTQIMNDLIVEKQRTKSQIYAVLTPEQRQKALQLMQQREQRHQERMQKKSQEQAQPSQ